MNIKRLFCEHKYLLRDSTGQGTVEFVLIAVVLVLFIFSIIDLSRAMSTTSFLAGAAQAGARAGAVSSNNASIEAAIHTNMSGFDSDSMTIAIEQTDQYTEVTLTYVFEPMTPFVASLGTENLTLSNTARMRKLGSGGEMGGQQATPVPTVATNTPAAATSTPGATNTPVPATATPASTSTPVPTATSCWPPGNCKNK